jgi:hypothetical protein
MDPVTTHHRPPEEAPGEIATPVQILEQDVPQFCFSERDGLFLTDEMQLSFLLSKVNGSFGACWLLPLSFQAYAAALRSGHPRICSFFEFVDFRECERHYRLDADHLSVNWLNELGLKFEVDGIDLARLDSPCQFQFFKLALYLEGTAERLVRAHPEVQTFYVIEGRNFLPLDFYFDSDVPAAILRSVCQRLSRSVGQFLMENRPYVFPNYRRRPMTSSSAATGASNVPDRLAGSLSRGVGFAPATVGNSQRILDAIQKIGCQVVLFSSTWALPPLFHEPVELEYQLSDQDGDASSDFAAGLESLWARIRHSWPRSTLPGSIAVNGPVGAQFEYIVTRRWLGYANMISRASRFVRQVPLKLFIHSEAFTAEGAILSSLYRRAGTRILVASHSNWPGDRNWATWKSSDQAIVVSHSARRRLYDLSGMRHISVVGHSNQSYHSLVQPPTASASIAARQRNLAGLSVVLLVTNALELLCAPFADPARHIRTLSALSQIPDHLRHRIQLAVRTKPRPLGEDPIIYQRLCGFSQGALTLLNGLTFSESIQAAECVVGVNIPTTGYFEIMERRVPLLHVQTTDAVALHPDLPAAVIPVVRAEEEIWPAIERLLRGSPDRETVLVAQRSFVDSDRKAETSGKGDPLEDVLNRATKGRWSFVPGRGRKREPLFSPANSLARDASITSTPGHGGGHVDDVLSDNHGRAVVIGWAADMRSHLPAQAIHVVVNGARVATGRPAQPRPDVVAAFGHSSIERAGFAIPFTTREPLVDNSLAVYAELHDGSFHKLPAPKLLTPGP